jgi:ribosomal protein S18 acetylase RimI-like enzyme
MPSGWGGASWRVWPVSSRCDGRALSDRERRDGPRVSGPLCSVRPAVAGDEAAIAGLHVRASQAGFRGLLPDAYLDRLPEQTEQRREMWRRLVGGADAGHRVWVAERDGELVGFCDTAPAPNLPPDTAVLNTIYVDPELVGTGVGTALMRRAAADLRERGYRAVVLWVQDANVRARRFYEKGGWVADGAEKSEDVWGTPVRQLRYRLAVADG